MSAELMISIICIASASMSILFLISVTREIKVTPEKLIKIFGKENIEKIKTASEEEIKEIIRNLPKRKKVKLKSLLESQDIRDVLKALDEHIINPKQN
jgi:RNA polymerase-interacting CarD/CdnL/TRCF family regulator